MPHGVLTARAEPDSFRSLLGMPPHGRRGGSTPPARLKAAPAYADKPSEMRPVNLLPYELRSGATSPASALTPGVKDTGGAGAYIVLGVLAVCVIALASYVLAGNVVKDRKAELARVSAESAAVSRQAAALKPYADFETLATARVQTVRDLASSRFDWEQALRDLSRVVPADVTLASLKGDLGGNAAASGGASASSGSGIRGAISAPAITLNGCTRSQTEVARLMARLRGIDGVTRVSLSQSNKADAASTAGTTTGSPATTGG